jgi:mono/diheme cytochrome c family protein
MIRLIRPLKILQPFLQPFLRWGSVGAVLLTVGCGTPGAVSSTPPNDWTAHSAAASPERAHIVAVYQSHCGSCHRPVEPGSEPSDRLETELERHHKRTRLTEAEWAGLDAFLVARP